MGTVRRPRSNEFLVFLLLNVIVSAVTVTVVLLLFGRVRTPESAEPTPTMDIAAQVASAIPTATITPIPPPTPVTYTVRSGDTLFGIASELGIDVEDLMAANGLSNPDTLDVGQVLVVPQVEGGGSAGEGSSPSTGQAEATPNPDAAAPQVEIREVTGAGEIESEMVFLVNRGGQVQMAGWKLEDGHGNAYTFPNFVLHNSGGVSLHTRAGRDSPIDLFWNLDEAVWLPGTTITLRDADNNVHSTFEIPGG
jgi:LysM repeat protein